MDLHAENARLMTRRRLLNAAGMGLGATALGAALRNNTSLQFLSLENNRMGDEGTAALALVAEMLPNTKIESMSESATRP